MGAGWYLSLLFYLLVGGVCVVLSVPNFMNKDATDSICNVPGCNCTFLLIWQKINCTFSNTQKVQFTEGSVPNVTMEISIMGGKEILIKPKVFKSLPALRRVKVENTMSLTTSKGAFDNVTSPKVMIQIQGCDELIVEDNAFGGFPPKTPLDFEATNCSRVSIGKFAFTTLQKGRFQFIQELTLAKEAFSNEASRHGLLADIIFYKVYIREIQNRTFPTSFNGISFIESNIDDIHANAFSAIELYNLHFKNSSIRRFQSNATFSGLHIFDFRISKCNISIIEREAINAGITNLTIVFSKIHTIESGGIHSALSQAIITDNEIATLHEHSFTFTIWNRINLNDNIIGYVESRFLSISHASNNIGEFSFKSNEIKTINPKSLDFLAPLTLNYTNIIFKDNLFHKKCSCDLSEWLMRLLDTNSEVISLVVAIMNTNFCALTNDLSHCFKSDDEITADSMTMQNFTEMVCKDSDILRCEPYKGEIIPLNNTTNIFYDEEYNKEKNSNLILGLVLGALLIIAISGTIVILLIRGGLWLKRYCVRSRNNMPYHQQDPPSLDEEGTIAETEISDKMDVPDELTPEMLQTLRERLEDPLTHEEAREMIERLYEHFIIHDEGYTNNTTQDEEAHLYEELGNLQMANNNYANQNHTEKIQNQNYQSDDNDESFGILKLMEERYNLIPHNKDSTKKPTLALEYSEPTDAAVHLYSELNQNKEAEVDMSKMNSFSPSHSSTFRSDGSSKMAFRPLPEKPGTSGENAAGPSK